MAVDMFLKLDGIPGESTDHKHKGEIELLSFSWGISNQVASGGGGSTGRAKISDLSIIKQIDATTPALFEKCCTGEHISDALITLSSKDKEKPIEYLKIKLVDILVSSYQSGGSNNGGLVPMETVSFSFSNVDISAADKSGKFGPQVSCNAKGNTDLGHHHD